MHRIITLVAFSALLGATVLVAPTLPSLAQSAPVQRPAEPEDIETAQAPFREHDACLEDRPRHSTHEVRKGIKNDRAHDAGRSG